MESGEAASADTYEVSQLIKAELRALGLPTHGTLLELRTRLFQARNNVTKKRYRQPMAENIDHELNRINKEIEELSLEIESGMSKIRQSRVLASTRLDKAAIGKVQKTEPNYGNLDRIAEWVDSVDSQSVITHSNMELTQPLSNPGIIDVKAES